MLEATTLLVHRSLWLASTILLVLGTCTLAFGVGWSAVEAASTAAVATDGLATHGIDIFGAACVAIAAGLTAYALFERFAADERTMVRIDFEQPIVGFHGRRYSTERWRVEARISVLARRTFAAVVRNRADDIAQAVAEALAVMGPRAAHAPDRTRAERALTVTVNRALHDRVVRSIRLRKVALAPAI